MTYATIQTTTMNGKKVVSTDFELGNSRLLRIETSKAYRGGVECCANVHTQENGFLSHSFSLGGPKSSGDFRKVLVSEPQRRATDKALLTAHATALVCIDDVIAEARAHYAAQVPAQAETRDDVSVEDATAAMDNFNYVGGPMHY